MPTYEELRAEIAARQSPPSEPIQGYQPPPPRDGGVTPTPPEETRDPIEPYPGDTPDFREGEYYDPDHYDPNERLPNQYGYQTGINGEENYNINVGMSDGLMDTINGSGNSRWANQNYDVRGGDAINRRVNQNETSQYQLQQMLASDSPLMQQAAEMGMARGGARGLMNSSLSQGAAQGAMISGAQPFALQDASWYGQTAQDNMNATNEMEQANLRARTSSMEAGARRDITVLNDQISGYGDIRKAMINAETREDEQAWKTGESEAGRSWQTGERLGTEEHTAAQNQLNRDWTSDENLLSNSLDWAKAKLSAATQMDISRGDAYASMYTSIMNNPNPKFKAAERTAALRNLDDFINRAYPNEAAGAFENSVDPITGEGNRDLMPPPLELELDENGNWVYRSQTANAPVTSNQSPQVAAESNELADW